jgi:membrane protein implicated in regulation of membrane protease activity
MSTLFLVCAAAGGVLLIAQLVMASMGVDHGHAGDAHSGDMHGGDVHSGDAHSGDAHLADGLNLLSVRAIIAAVAFFGIGGLGAQSLGWPTPIAVLVAALLGFVSMVGVAWIMRSMLKLQRDATVRITDAIGLPATVYIPIPAALSGVGKVTVSLNGRSVECQAVTPDGQQLQTGSAVVVVDVRDDDTLEVVPLPSVDGVP